MKIKNYINKFVKVILCSLFVLLFVSGCKKDKKDYPNLLFITVDTTRADRLSCYGYTNAVTPYIHGLANAGVLFENAQSCVPLTLPSHTTMFTGLIPPEHGLRVNGENVLSKSIPTMAEVLKANGYQTAAVTASPVVDSVYGLSRGFDFYQDDLAEDGKNRPQMRIDGGDGQDELYRPGNIVADISLEWLKKATSENKNGAPWFLWAHFYDPHHPWHSHEYLFKDHFKEKYDAEVAFMDIQIGRLLEFIGKKNIKENTIVVVVGDHGEGLGDHGEQDHGYFLYQTTQHVPLIMTWKKKFAAGTRVPAYLSLADIMPTLFDVMGVNPDIYKPSSDSRNKRLRDAKKRSFSAALMGESIESRSCYMETLWGYYSMQWAPLFGLVENSKKFIRAPKSELYDLKADPHETTNLFASKPRVADEMAISLEEREARMLPPEIESAGANKEQLAKLQSLGYTSGSSNSTTGDVTKLNHLPDPKDYKKVLVLKNKVSIQLRNKPRSPETLKMCHDLVDVAPPTGIFYSWLARATAATEKKKEAIDLYRKAVELDPDQIEIRNNFGILLAMLRQNEEALVQFRKAYELKPHDELVQYNYVLAMETSAMNLIKQKKFGEAEACFKKMLQVSPDSYQTYCNLGKLEWLLDRNREAEKAIKKALELKPDYKKAQKLLNLIEKEKDSPSAKQ